MAVDGKAIAFIDLPYIVVDAALGALLEGVDRGWKWTPITHGSSTHTTSERVRAILVFTLYAVALERTQIFLTAPHLNLDVETANALASKSLKQIREMIMRNYTGTNDDDVALIMRDLADTTIAAKGGRGAAAKHDNEWARERIAAGDDRAVVYQEWLTRKNIDVADVEAEQLARDAFRKAIARMRTDGRK